MYCSNCGAKILDDSIFCSECGMRIQQVKSMGTHVGEEDVEFAEMEVSGILHVDIEESTEELSAEGESLAGTTDEEEVQEKLIVEEDTLPDVMEEEKPRQRKKLRRHNNREKDTLLNMKDKKGWGVAGIALTSLLIITVVVICVLSAGKKAAYATEHFSVSAKMTDDGTAYIPLDEGKCIAINEEVKSAMLTKDRKRIVVLLEDGLLYITDINLSEKHKITDNAADILAIRNDGFIYRDKKDCDYRVFFSDYSDSK